MFVLALRKASLLNGDMNIHPTLNIMAPSLVPEPPSLSVLTSLGSRLLRISLCPPSYVM